MLNTHLGAPSSHPDDGHLICYGIIITCASLILLCVLAATVSVAKACAFAGAVALLFGIVGVLTRLCADTGATAGGLPTTTATAAPRPARAVCAACGLVDAAINALPAFAYANAAADQGSSKSGRRALCPVCLEGVQAGEMVRRLPACRHLFHVECIDMWLHSHSTCPLCRCSVAPPQPANAKDTAAATAGAQPPADALPPV